MRMHLLRAIALALFVNLPIWLGVLTSLAVVIIEIREYDRCFLRRVAHITGLRVFSNWVVSILLFRAHLSTCMYTSFLISEITSTLLLSMHLY